VCSLPDTRRRIRARPIMRGSPLVPAVVRAECLAPPGLPVYCCEPSDPSVSNHPWPFREPCFGLLFPNFHRVIGPVSCPVRHPSGEVTGVTWASPLLRRLAKATGRIEFTFVTDESFASGCSPPHLVVTQLPSATRSQTSSRRGLAPRILTTITGARSTAVPAADAGGEAGR
jgi:hypothetical protein